MVEGIPIHFVIEFELVYYIIPSVFVELILIFADNLKTSVLFNNLTDIVNEAVEGIDLLADETILSKVSIDYFPGMPLVDSLVFLWHI